MPDFNDTAYGWNAPQQMPGVLGAPQPSSFVPFGQPSRPGLLSTLGQALVAGMAGGEDLQSGLAEAGQNAQYVRARRLDDNKKAALNAWLKAKSGGDPAALKQATDALYQADPAIAESMAVNEMTPHRQFTQVGQSIMGQPQYGFVDPVAGSVEPVAQSGGLGGDAAGAGSGSGNLYGSLPKAQQAQVDQIIQGKMPYPSGYQLAKSPYWNSITAAAEERAQALGVPLDANLYPTRLATRKDFTAGQVAKTITAGNNAIGHLGRMDEHVDPLGNSDSGWPGNYTYNQLRNSIKQNSGTATDLQAFETAKKRFADEITSFYTNGGGSISDRDEAMRQLDSARSPSELHATIKEQVALLHSKLAALQHQWHQGMGANEPDFPILSDEANGVIKRIVPPEAQAAGAGRQARPRAVNPQTGAAVEFDGQAWVPVQ